MLFEGDSLSVISELKKEGPCVSGCGLLISYIKLILSSLDHLCFQHVKRDANKAAHYIAKFALSQLIDEV